MSSHKRYKGSSGLQNKKDHQEHPPTEDVNIINQLNDECLINIFRYLDEADKFKVPRICKRWRNLNKDYWSNVQESCFIGFLDSDDTSDDDLDNNTKEVKRLQKKKNKKVTPDEIKVKKRTDYFVNIAKNCGPYLNNIRIDYQLSGTERSEVLKAIAMHCYKLREISCFYFSDYNVYLALIFSNNTKLESISMNYSNLLNICKSRVNFNYIEELELNNCFCKDKNLLINFLSRLINLKKIEIRDNESGVMVVALEALSNCNNLKEISLNSKKIHPNHEIQEKLLFLISKNKNLKKLDLYDNLSIDNNFIIFLKLTCEFMEEITGFIYNESISHAFYNFKSLKKLSLSISVLTDQCIKGISECRNIEYLQIYKIKRYLLTPIGEIYFRNFKKILDFGISVQHNQNIDNILISLVDANTKLQRLNIGCAEITDLVINSIMKFTDLIDLEVFATYIQNEQLLKCVKACVHLEKLDILCCENITNEFVYAAKKVKDCQDDKRKLVIWYSDSGIDAKSLKDIVVGTGMVAIVL